MNAVGLAERATLGRVIALFREELGYRYLVPNQATFFGRARWGS
jgi:hypothetical protein